MDISRLLYNVRGLTTDLSQTCLRKFLSSMKFEVLFLQEHKVRDVDWTVFGRKIWKFGTFTAAPAASEAQAARNDTVLAGKGGLVTAVLQKLVPFVTSHHVTLCGQVIYVILDRLSSGPLGLVNVYGPNDSLSRSQLWDTLVNCLDPCRPWIFGGDFNMTTHAVNQLGGVPHDLVGHEATAWTSLQSTFGLSNCRPQPVPALQYTWDNNRLHTPGTTPICILKWLDQFYLSLQLLG
jgi:hypothetical protein